VALERCSRALALDAGFVVGHQWRARAFEALGRFDEAVADLQAAADVLGDDPENLASLGHALARAGRRGDAETAGARLAELEERRYVSPYWRAVYHAGLGESEAALDALEAAIDSRADWVVALPVEPMFDDFRSLPRFRALVERLRPRSRAR
jgi:tetratricopeptide (TPR) repeat protein